MYKLRVTKRGDSGGTGTKGDCHYGTGKLFYYVFTNCDYCYNLEFSNRLGKIIGQKCYNIFCHIFYCIFSTEKYKGYNNNNN